MLEVGAVGHIGKVVEAEVFFDVLSADTQQWSYDAVVLGVHACQSAQSGAAQKVQQEGFRLVVHVMAYGYGLGLLGFHLFLEPLVAQFSRRHFNADAVAFGVVGCVEMCDAQTHSELLAQLFYELLVGV